MSKQGKTRRKTCTRNQKNDSKNSLSRCCLIYKLLWVDDERCSAILRVFSLCFFHPMIITINTKTTHRNESIVFYSSTRRSTEQESLHSILFLSLARINIFDVAISKHSTKLFFIFYFFKWSSTQNNGK